jgi:hypothetical protein
VEVRGTTTETAPAARRVDPAEVLRTPGALDNIFRALQMVPGVVATQESLGFISGWRTITSSTAGPPADATTLVAKSR